MDITIPELALVLLIGPSGCGKTAFARQHFRPTEVLSLEEFHDLIADTPDADVADDACEIMHLVAEKRLKHGRLAVIDAPNLSKKTRAPLLALARQYYCPTVAVVFELPESVCAERNEARGKLVDEQAISWQFEKMKLSFDEGKPERFHSVYVIETEAQESEAAIRREPPNVNRKHLQGPFDIVGDVHGCFDELLVLLDQLTYLVEESGDSYFVTPPEDRMLVFVGDLVDRGPKSPDVLRLVMGMVEAGTALCVPGNHDDKLMRALKGRKVQVKHGLEQTLAQLANEPPEFKQQIVAFFESLPSHVVLDGGNLVVAHAGMPEAMQGRGGVGGAVYEFALYGETTGELDEYGLPARGDWAAKYHGKPLVVYGHTPVATPRWVNNAVNIDTGCVFGGTLTALRYPELDTVSVRAMNMYAESRRPFMDDV